ncbi:MAG: hypothetical protein MJ229_03955 [bacterium]|nr:hypothetical protein [bacterium]
MNIKFQNNNVSFESRSLAAKAARRTNLIAKNAAYHNFDTSLSSKQILNTVDNFSQKINKLMLRNGMNVQTVQEAVNNCVPDFLKNKIFVKTFENCKNDLMHQGVSQKDAEHKLNIIAGMEQRGNIYLNFEKMQDYDFDPIFFKRTATHELKHALTELGHNTSVYMNSRKFADVANSNFFNEFEKDFYKYFYNSEPVNCTDKDLYSIMKVNSEEELFKVFQGHLHKTANILSEKNHINKNMLKTKHFYEYMKLRANDEKEAYLTNKVLKENFPYPPEHIDSELVPMFYSKMAKFFANKAKKCEIL